MMKWHLYKIENAKRYPFLCIVYLRSARLHTDLVT